MDITSGDELGEKGRDVSVVEVKVQRAVGIRVEWWRRGVVSVVGEG